YNNIINILFFFIFGIIFVFEKNYNISISNITIFYFLFSIFCFSSIFWALDFSLSYGYYTRLIISTLNFIVIYTIFQRYNLEQTILYGILIGVFYNILIGFDVIHPSYEIFKFGRFTGSLGNSNKLSKTMLLGIFASLVLLSKSKIPNWFRLLNQINIILSFYIIILTVSKKAMMLAPIMILLSFSVKDIKIKNILIYITLIFIIIKLLLTYGDMEQFNTLYELIEKRFSGMFNMMKGKGGDASSMERIYLVKEGLKIFENNPIFGIGLNNSRYLLVKYTHNNYLELLIGTGIIGTTLFYSIYIVTFQKIKNMPSIRIKKYFYIMLFILLLLDTSTVTYYTKPILFLILYIYFVAEKEIEKNKLAKKEYND
ncbi:MAG: O-antigen ligase family protein, partial [Sulfurovaceae bacterium]|nr:O-antigen ligase family protein [Sulfurovaceae bacterium]